MVAGVPGLAPLALGYVCAAPYQGLSADIEGGSSDYGATGCSKWRGNWMLA